MEFKIHDESDGSFSFYTKGYDRIKPCIRVYDAVDDFNPERTCRMIEKMEEMLALLKKTVSQARDEMVEELPDNHFQKSYCNKYTIVNAGVTANLIKNIVDYIEHGDKEEMTPKEMLKILAKHHKEGNLMSVFDNYKDQIERVCND